MGSNPDFLLLVIAAVAGLIAHIGLAISARYFNPLWTLTGVFCIMVPLSMAVSLPGFTIFKYGRTYVDILLIAIAFFIYRNYRFRGISLAWVAFSLFYMFAALWSDEPIVGLFYKGLTVLCVIASVLTGYQIASLQDLQKSMRIILCCACVFGLIIAGSLLTGYQVEVSNDNRLTILGMSANRLGGDGAAMFLFCCIVVLYDRNKLWKAVALACGILLVFAVMRTGSRGSAVLGAFGAFIMALPMVKRPLLLVTVGLISALGLYFLVPSGATEAFEGRGFAREHVWQKAIDSFNENPALGAGWVYSISSGRGIPSTTNLHSFYFQIIGELGIVGVLFFSVLIIAAFIKGLSVLSQLRQDKELFPWAFVAAALIGAPLAHGLGESSTLTAGSITSVMLAMGFAFLDRLPEMARERQNLAAAHQLQEEWDAHHQQQIIDDYTAHPA